MTRLVPRRSRRWAGIALAAATLVAVLAMLLGGLRFTVLNDKRFSDSVAASLSKPQVSRFVGERTATQLVNARPQLQGLEPLIASTMTAVSRTRPVRGLVRVAAGQFQRIVIAGDRNAAALVVANLAVFITEALKSLRPEVAARVPSNLAVTMASLQSGGAAEAINDIAHTADQLRVALWISIGLALALLAAAVALAEDRARTVQWAGFALALAGVVAAGLFALAIVALPAGLHDSDARQAARAVLASVLDPAIRLNIGIALIGAIAGVCARSVIEKERLDLLARRVALTMWRGPLTRIGDGPGDRRIWVSADGEPAVGPEDRGGARRGRTDVFRARTAGPLTDRVRLRDGPFAEGAGRGCRRQGRSPQGASRRGAGASADPRRGLPDERSNHCPGRSDR